MLKQNHTRYNNTITNFIPLRKISPSPKLSKNIKYLYKQLYVNSFFLKKHKIVKYTTINIKIKKINKFNSNFILKKFIKRKKKTNKPHIWFDFNTVPKNLFIKKKNFDFQSMFFLCFFKLNLIDFKCYWLSIFLQPFLKSKSYYFTNNTKFFSNQRLVKQPLLLMYNTINKSNYYSNYLRIFKGFILKKKLNDGFFFKSIMLQLYPKINTPSYFFRHDSFIRKFITQSYLKLVPT